MSSNDEPSTALFDRQITQKYSSRTPTSMPDSAAESRYSADEGGDKHDNEQVISMADIVKAYQRFSIAALGGADQQL